MVHSEMKAKALWLTGLSGAGKSTIAEALKESLNTGGYSAGILDGDVVRALASNTIGFCKEERIAHGMRVGRLALEMVQQNETAIVALISPYAEGRQRVRDLFSAGSFVEVHVSTPLEVCAERDVKGLYAKAFIGAMPQFTGVSDFYDIPQTPEVTVDTSVTPLEVTVQRILAVSFPDLIS